MEQFVSLFYFLPSIRAKNTLVQNALVSWIPKHTLDAVRVCFKTKSLVEVYHYTIQVDTQLKHIKLGTKMYKVWEPNVKLSTK